MMEEVFNGKVSVNGQNYEFVLKNGKFYVFQNNDGNLSFLNLDLLNTTDKELILAKAIDSIMEAIRKAIETQIKNNIYKNTLEIQDDLKLCISRINVPELKKMLNDKDITDNKSVKEAIDSLTLSFLKQNQTVEEKKEIVQENIDVNLDTLFKEHGITEYNIDSSKSIVVYYKNGVPHTINNSNPNESIYDLILSQINLDRLTSKEDIDKAIDDIMELDANYKYSKNRDTKIANLDKKAINVADYLSNTYGNIKMSGQVLADPLFNKSLLLADLNGSMTPIYIGDASENVIIGEEKSIDNTKTVETSIKDDGIYELEKDLEKENVKDKTKKILLKCYQDEDLTDEEIEFADFYREDAIFESLDVEIRLWMLQIHDYIDAMNNELEKETEKVKKMEFPHFKNEEAKELTTFAVILAVIMGSIMILTIGMLV